jgi:DNA-binding CsgD family transcriptional regulator
MMRDRTYKSGLTKTHLQVISCVGEGYTHKEIAHELGLQRKTVSFHVGNIYRIMRMNRIEQIVRLAIAFGLCSPLCVLLFAGCATKPKPTVPPIPTAEPKPLVSPKAKAMAAPQFFAAPAAAKPRDYFVHIDYPSDETNYVWYLQESADSNTWSNTATKQVVTAFDTKTQLFHAFTNTVPVSFKGRVSTNSYTVQMPPHTKVYFWRLNGIK